MNFGLKHQEYQFLKEKIFDPIRMEMEGRVWVFGSRARGDHHPFSDLDLLVCATFPQGWIENLRETLENSNLPFKVEIVEINNLAVSYRDQVMREKVEIL